MQIRGLHKNIYRLYRYSRTQECLDEYRKIYEDGVRRYEVLLKEGVCHAIIQQTVGISRATYYRHKKILDDLAKGIRPPSKKPRQVRKPLWGESELQKVLGLRRENPTYGKAKIAVILKRDLALTISESTVGRILTYLLKKGLIRKSLSCIRAKRKRNFAGGHAKSWYYKDYKDMSLGERVQIDHMTATKNGVPAKHFQAWDRKSKYIHANIYSNATAKSAKRFLVELMEICPFPITSIQVDGGSEFMADFESASRELGLELFVLPPAKPKYNGGVERGNRIFREEFYARNDVLADSLGALRYDLAQAVKKYNSYRPHAALSGKTPLECVNILLAEAS